MKKIDFQEKEIRHTMRFFGFRDRAVRVLMAVLVTAMIFALYGCSGNLDEKNEQKSLISVDTAKEMAFYDSGADPENTLITRRKLIDDDGPVYLICFTTWTENRTIRYEYDIDGTSGEVKESRKKIQSFAPAKIKGEDKASEYRSGKDFIGVAKARKLVLEDAGLDAEETEFRSIRLESRDKRALYVTEFYSMGITYMFHIDAVNGKVLSREVQFND